MLVTDRKTDYFEKRAGGTGTTIMEHIIDEKVYKRQNCKLMPALF